jgi:signal peptidase I
VLRLLPLAAVAASLTLAGLVAAQAVVVDGSSMAPALHSGQVLVVHRTAYLFGGPRRGDVVVFRDPTHPGRQYVKRVIGLPGDHVLIEAGQVLVNDAVIDEPYVVDNDDYSYPPDGRPVRVPDGAYFVLGDNRPVSADSHLGWFVAAADLLGQAWPLPAVLTPRPA